MDRTPTRRQFISQTAVAGLVAAAGLPGLALAAAPTDRRLLLVILRGGMDGLSALPPYGDPEYDGLRGELRIARPESAAGALRLDGLFGLHPALKPLYPFFERDELLPIHAIAIPQRTRSHFDAQDVLENGAARAHTLPDGWLNRALRILQTGDNRLGLAVGYAIPPVLRGGIPVASWAPANLPPSAPSLLDKLALLYDGDPVFGPALSEGRRVQEMTGKLLGSKKMKRGNLRSPGRFKILSNAAGRLLAAEDGARVAVVEMGGWDTHANQGAHEGRLARNLFLLAQSLSALPEQLGPAWHKTVVIVATEFGRTARMNGTRGTDHGTAGAAFLLGGAVAGGRVAARWPGLTPDALFQNRDLAATSDLRGLFKTVLRDHMGIAATELDQLVFPESTGALPPPGRLIRT